MELNLALLAHGVRLGFDQHAGAKSWGTHSLAAMLLGP